MGIYFRKRIKILPGIHLNVSKTGTSWTLGGRGASVNVGKKGVYANAGISGTGIYSRTKLSGNKPNRSAIRREKENEVINRNPLRFILVFLFLWLSVMIPIMSNASWIWFPILAFVGICCAFIPDRKGKDYEFEIQPTQKQSGVKMEEITHDSGKVEEMTDKSVRVRSLRHTAVSDDLRGGHKKLFRGFGVHAEADAVDGIAAEGLVIKQQVGPVQAYVVQAASLADNFGRSFGKRREYFFSEAVMSICRRHDNFSVGYDFIRFCAKKLTFAPAFL